MRTRLLGLAAIAAGLLASSAAFATPIITIDGISFALGAQFDSTDVYENNVTTPGQHLTGVGLVDNIKDSNGDGACGISTICWQNGDNGTELTFTFDYVLQGIQAIGGGQAEAVFSGGVINFYADNTPDANPNTGTGYTDGTLWLTLTGGATGDTCAGLGLAGCFNGDPLTLVSTFAANGSLQVNGTGGGHGYLDVDSSGTGDANTNYDTNGVDGGAGGIHDLSLDTSFNSLNPTATFGITGTASLKANTVPEPISISLFGAGLVGAAAFGARRRKSKKA